MSGQREAPDYLVGDEGETTFVRRDLADTPTSALAYVLEHEGANLSHYDADEVEMLEVPSYFTGIDDEWATVVPGTPGAVAYWRFRA